MSDTYDVVQVYCEGSHHSHTPTPVGAFHRPPGERWTLSGMDQLWPPDGARPAALADGPRTMMFDGNEPVFPGAPRGTRFQYHVKCPVCPAHGEWNADTVQQPLSVLVEALGRPVGRLSPYRDTRVADVPFQLVESAIDRAHGVSRQ